MQEEIIKSNQEASESPTQATQERKKTILSGITPSGILTLGHLTGALINWQKLQRDYDSFFMVADLHAITVRQVPAELRKRTTDTLAMFIAAGIDPEKSTLFVQSHVPEHSQLTWVMNTFTGMGECSRMTQFKDKSQKHAENVNVGLFSYPILMACDILLYQADLVPVGEDQKQHLELSRNLAQRFNHNYSQTFTIPEPYIAEVGARIMSLQEPNKKMSKSDENQNSTIFLDDSHDLIIKKIKRAVTDSDNLIKYSDDKPGIKNLIELYNITSSKTIPEIEAYFDGAGYGEFKSEVADSVANFVAPIRDKYLETLKNKKLLNDIMQLGAEKARAKAWRTLDKVYKKVGFLQLK